MFNKELILHKNKLKKLLKLSIQSVFIWIHIHLKDKGKMRELKNTV